MILALLMLPACKDGDPVDTGAEPLLPPDDWGPYTVGTFESEVPGSAGLTLPVQVWFPTDVQAAGVHRYDDLMEGTALSTEQALCPGPRPVLLFSHGNGGLRFQSIYLTEWLASHGWVVVAPDHVGNTWLDLGDVPRGEMAFRRPADIVDSFDWLVGGEVPGNVADCVDESAGYAIAGHSFGGYTTLALAGATLDLAAVADDCTGDDFLCEDMAAYADESLGGELQFDLSDPRIWAAVPLAPAGDDVLLPGGSDLTVPTMVLGGGHDTLIPMDSVRALWGSLAAQPDLLGELPTANHYTFSNACDFLPTPDFCGSDDDLPTEEAHPLIATLVTAFLRSVQGDEEAAQWLPPEGADVVWEDMR